MMTFLTEWKNKIHVPNHQPEINHVLDNGNPICNETNNMCLINTHGDSMINLWDGMGKHIWSFLKLNAGIPQIIHL